MLLHGNGLCMLIKSDESSHAHIHVITQCTENGYFLCIQVKARLGTTTKSVHVCQVISLDFE